MEIWDASVPRKIHDFQNSGCIILLVKQWRSKNILSLSSIDYLKSEEIIKRQNMKYIIVNKECLFPHIHLHPLKYRMVKYILI